MFNGIILSPLPLFSYGATFSQPVRYLVNLNFKHTTKQSSATSIIEPNEWPGHRRSIKNVVFFFLTPFDLNIKLWGLSSTPPSLAYKKGWAEARFWLMFVALFFVLVLVFFSYQSILWWSKKVELVVPLAPFCSFLSVCVCMHHHYPPPMAPRTPSWKAHAETL